MNPISTQSELDKISYRFLEEVLADLKMGKKVPKVLETYFHQKSEQGESLIPLKLEMTAFDDSKDPSKKGDMVLRLGFAEGVDTGLQSPSLAMIAKQAGLAERAEGDFPEGNVIKGYAVPKGSFICDNPAHKMQVSGAAEMDGTIHRQSLYFHRLDIGILLTTIRGLYLQNSMREKDSGKLDRSY